MTRSSDPPITKLLIILHHRFELWNAPEWFTARLRTDFPQLEIVHLTSYDQVASELPEADIAVTWSLRPEQFALARKLRWIHSPAAAVHLLMFPELIDSGEVVTNAREVHGPVVAEHVIALIFALARKVPAAVRLQQEHIWGQELLWRQSPRPREVAGATLGLVGLGSIGREVARKASALGMKVVAVRENPTKEEPQNIQQVYSPDQLDQLLQQSDFVVLAAPVTAATQGMINAERFSQMKPDAHLINVGRGPLIDEAALIDALSNHKIAGAALDVFTEEPLPANSHLWDLPNLLITPHSAGLTEKLWERHYSLLSGNLRRFLAGEPLLSQVDKKRGY